MRFPAMVREQGQRAAIAGAPPSTCPYRFETSRARLLWLEGYLAGLDSDACPPIWRTYRPLADMLRCAVARNLDIARAGNIVAFTPHAPSVAHAQPAHGPPQGNAPEHGPVVCGQPKGHAPGAMSAPEGAGREQ